MLAMDDKNEKESIGVVFLENLTEYLAAIVIGGLLLFGFLEYTNWKYDRQKDPEPPMVTVNPEFDGNIKDFKHLYIEDDTYIIELRPEADIATTYYQVSKRVDDRPLRLFNEDNTIESGDDTCYCFLDGEPIATLEDLAKWSNGLEVRLRCERIMTPEELQNWDRYKELTEQNKRKGIPEDPTQAIADELGMSRDDAFAYTYRLFRLSDGQHEQLSPALFWDNILMQIISYNPEAADPSYFAADATIRILNFVTDYHLHLDDQETINQLMSDAVTLLTEEEKEQLPESMPGMISLIDETLASYPENRSMFEMFEWNIQFLDNAVKTPGAKEDWARVKTALQLICPTGEDTTA